MIYLQQKHPDYKNMLIDKNNLVTLSENKSIYSQLQVLQIDNLLNNLSSNNFNVNKLNNIDNNNADDNQLSYVFTVLNTVSDQTEL